MRMSDYYIIVYATGLDRTMGAQRCDDIEEVKAAIQRALQLGILNRGGEIKIYQERLAA